MDEGCIHMGKEMTIATLKIFGECGVSPLLAAPMCKAADALEMEGVVQKIFHFLQVNPLFLKMVQLWSFVTDGDATQHLAGFRLFLWHKLADDNPLHAMVSKLQGLKIM
ncbi:hypothetical protein JAAARDRAFT_197922 [Jaapia argillacea MUCL 33604]|uniref:Uncharacterized protein n=1 Tax=Jaapia argillacea MUCL 33604 TaxID=933084 RepID=A0A067PRB2_9AGAM|nr:hypothetical protein JAAARDRAFT_197922 [Jaapia argillacea MUCL 33604]